MVTIRNETARDVERREAMLDRVWGRLRVQKTAERLREGRLPAELLSFIAEVDGCVVGTVRLWHISAGPDRPALLLGPLAVDEGSRGRGIGSALVRHAAGAAAALGHNAILLVGDAPYYGRFGFTAEKTGRLWLPGPYEQKRLLGCELAPDALDGARGMVSATGRAEPRPDMRALVEDLVRKPVRPSRAA
jgi:predicted N-acetyltransferase YhbS